MSEVAITQEQMFRVVYAEELKKKRDNELQDERRRVNYQEGKTPGRRGEIIMQDEISKETIRRYYLNQKKRLEAQFGYTLQSTHLERSKLSAM
jgi:hypothetical protein